PILNNMKSAYRILILVLLTLPAWSQSTGSLRGTVKTSDGNPAQLVSVTLEEIHKGTTADREGNFEIRNLVPGNYTLVVSFVGLGSQRKPVEIRAGETATVDFVLSENARELEEVVISGTHEQ